MRDQIFDSWTKNIVLIFAFMLLFVVFVNLSTNSVIVEDSSGNDLRFNIKSVEDGSEVLFKSKEAVQDVVIRPNNKKISLKSIVFKSVATKDLEKLKIDEDIEEKGAWDRVYAIDPTEVEFDNATVTVVATGTLLYKCKDWNFAEQRCYGDWSLFKDDLIPGEEYSFILTQDDPGFAETVSTCSAEDQERNAGTFAQACLDPTGAYLEQDDGTTEDHTYLKVTGKDTYAGVKIESVDSGVTVCDSITKVEICYDWWDPSGNGATCDVSVDADGGASFTAVTSTCPGTSSAGVTCTDVTSLETWTCASFFGASGTRAQAKSEVGANPKNAETVHWDVLYFNVTYSEIDTAPPIISGVNTTSIDNESAVIVWDTDELSNSTVNYASDEILNLSASDPAFVTSHNVSLSGLIPDTEYYFNVTSCDANGYCNTSETHNFTTTETPDLSPPIITLKRPVESWEDPDGEVTFAFEVQDLNSGMDNCSFIINGVVNQTIMGVDWEEEIEFEFVFGSGSNDWRVECFDNSTQNNLAVSKQRNFSINITSADVEVYEEVEDADGNAINTTLEIFNSTSVVYNYTGKYHQKKLKKGFYDVKIKPVKHPIKQLDIKDVYFNITTVGIMDLDDTPESKGYIETYAINPLVNFTNATVTVNARGHILYKCKDWNYSARNCFGKWEKLKLLKVGEEYTFILTPNDPALSESAGTFFDGFESGLYSTNEWTTSGGLSNDWTINSATNQEKLPNTGTYSGIALNTDAESNLYVNISTVGFTNVNLSFYHYLDDADAGEYYRIYWWDGTQWVNILDRTGPINDGAWNLYSNASLGALADNNPDFRLRFACLVSTTGEFCNLDDVRVEGIDALNPSVIDITPTPATSYSPSTAVNITVNVTDNVAVDVVQAQIDWPGNTQTITMTDPNTDDVYNATFTQTSTEAQYNITIIANDTTNNVNNTETTYFTILDAGDAVDPVINTINDAPDPVDPGNTINITTNVTDDINVSQVWVEINNTNYTMIPDGTDTWYYDLFDTDILAGLYIYTVYANDTSNNNATPQLDNFTINCVTSISVSSVEVNFTSVAPGQESNATTATGYPINITNIGNCPLNLSVSGTNLTGVTDPSYEMDVSNVRWDTDSGFGSSTALSTTSVFVAGSIAVDAIQQVYFRLTSPLDMISQYYSGTVDFTSEQE